MTRSEIVEVWNRAAMAQGGPAPREGDVALASLLRVHGMVMNGGVDHAVEVVAPEDYAAGIEGFGSFSLPDAAAVLEAALRATTDEDFERLNAAYGAAVSDDDVIGAAFETALSSTPAAFAPPDGTAW